MDNELRKKLEAALFMAPTHIGVEDLARLSKSTVQEVKVALNELVHEYAERESAIIIEEGQAGFRMKIRPEFEEEVSHLAASSELHKGIMKTLSYVAYKQPVKQTEVIKFRNTKAYDHIKVLEEKGFIKREKAGVSYVITTTKKFHDYFTPVKKEKAQQQTYSM